MAFTLTRGTTYSLGSTVNQTNIAALIEGATLAGGDRTGVNLANVCPFTFAAAAPNSPVEKELWQNSSSFQVLAWNSHFSRWEATTTNADRLTVASTSAAITAGYALKAVNGLYVALADGGVNAENVIGVASHSAVANGSCAYVWHGIVRAAVTGTVNAGEKLQLSATAGLLQSGGNVVADKGYVAVALTAGSGGFAWINLKR